MTCERGRQTRVKQRNNHGLTRRIGLAGLLGLSGLVLTGCNVAPPDNGFFHALRMGWPTGITPESKEMGNLWVWVWVTAWIVGIVMWGLLFLNMGRNSAKRQAKKGNTEEFPRQTGYNVPLELVLTTLPVLIIMGLFFFNVQAQDSATALDKDPKVRVDVTGFQWNWKFGYGMISSDVLGQNYDGTDQAAQKQAEDSKYPKEGVDSHGHEIVGPVHGRSEDDYSYLNFDKIETVGTTEEIPVLVLPTNTAIEFNLASADVVHSFWIPEFLFKRDVFPHPDQNKSERRFQIEQINQEGAFVGRCAEMCGTYHSMMNFELRAVSPEKFKEYIQFREANPQAPNSDALKKIGEAPYAVTTHPFKTDRTGTRSFNDNYKDPNAA